MKKEKKYLELVKKLHPVAGDLLLCHGLNMAQASMLADGMRKRGAYKDVWLVALPHGTTIEQAGESEMNRMGWYKKEPEPSIECTGGREWGYGETTGRILETIGRACRNPGKEFRFEDSRFILDRKLRFYSRLIKGYVQRLGLRVKVCVRRGEGVFVKSTFKGVQHQLKEGQKHAKR